MTSTGGGANRRGAMHAIRAFFRRHHALALGLVLMALAMKALVPAGFMPAAPGKVLTVILCDGHGSEQATKIALADSGAKQGGSGGLSEAAKAAGTCPYAGLSSAALGGTDAALAVVLLLFILALGFAPTPIPPLRRRHHVLPPLRGPPVTA